ncbi:GCN5-related N-acetyltransferase [Alteracholeplasma palmae J233]|uniref:GCN5-related N-acetyltransferase n=1 Tax=Alteracholeplasma palmae (strain ATCC 49389 / J233) TaxID=1318466 RepID=U4KK52_ALTPJ|nr:GNAT family N-acetyltransferase [Alteracholeplasma palmae]CCV63897.1 GCN5-related N-acetyltransferase [Alteracholeplasma palmae J233]
MEKLYLRLMKLEAKEIVLDFIKEMIEHASDIHGLWYTHEETFEKMYEAIQKHSIIKYEGYEQKTPIKYQYLLMSEKTNKLIGVISIRPYLNRSLDESFGGNIGYSIRPSERKKGYATEGLRLAVLETKKINPKDPVMVCCNKYNIGSKKAILNNGGILKEEKNALISEQKYLIY